MMSTCLITTTMAPAFAVTSSPVAPALAGLAAAPAPGLETSGEGAGAVSPYDVYNAGGAGLMSLMSGPEEQKSAKFEPPDTPYNGAFTRSLPIQVPPFFELTPTIALRYNSADNRQHSGDGFSLLGIGWTMSGGGLIERESSHGGLPRFDATDGFELDGNGLMDCVVDGVTRETPSCSAGGTHTARYESYERIKKIAADNSWQVTARDGTVSVYRPLGFFSPSGSEDARLRNDYRWLLASITDTDGNAVSYSYDCAALPTCYVIAIGYGSSSIQFFWETRTDTFTHATGISLANVTKRLKTIAVKTGTSLIRAYDLAYAISPDTRRSLLTGFRQYGSDATLSGAGVITAGTSLPADSFTYYDMSTRRKGTMISDLVTANTAAETTPSTAAVEATASTALPAGTHVVGDFDGNGKDDIIGLNTKVDEGEFCSIKYYRDGQWYASEYSHVYGGVNIDQVPVSPCSGPTSFFVTDSDGDGLDEINVSGVIGVNGVSQVLRSQLSAAGFGSGDLFVTTIHLQGSVVTDVSVTGVDSTGGYSGAKPLLTGDFDGDGRTDFYRGAVFRSTGTGFSKEIWVNQEYGRTGDFNGDGLTDMFVLDGVNGTESRLLLSTGSSFEPVPLNLTLTQRGDYPWPEFETSAHLPGVGGWEMGDVNGDGTLDVMHNFQNHPATYFMEATGNGFVNRLLLPSGPTGLLVEVNGDGRADYVTGSQVRIREGDNFPSTSRGIAGLTGTDFNGDGKSDGITGGGASYDSVLPDLLKRHTLSTGGTIDVEYLPSTYWSNGYMPLVVQAVSKVTTSDGLGNSSKLKYAYEGGAYDLFERKFLGFSRVTAELPCETGETTCPWVHAWYRQEAVAAGSLSKLEVYAPNGQLQRRIENGYVVNQASAPFTAFKTSEQVTDYLVGGTATTRKEWTYDGYANLIEEKALGALGSTVDDVTSSTSYELNLAAYIVDRPGRVTLTDAMGALLRDTQIFYDGAGAAGIEPTRGHATTTRRWLASESRWIASTAEYDSFGNPSAELDPLGNRSARLYDATHQYVVEERNPLWFDGDTRQKTLTSWHALCGAPAVRTDGNGLVTSTTYDALCRETRIDYPSGDYRTTAYLNLGVPTTQYVETASSPADGINPIWSRSYLDGLGRVYKETGIGATAAAQPVVTETKYAKRGEANKQSLPYFQGGTVYWTTTKFDVLGRPVLVTLPDNATMATAYEAPAALPGVVTVKTTDTLARLTRVTIDAGGREIGRTGTLGATAVTTSFGFDPLGNLETVTDPMGNSWSNSHDSLGRRVASSDPDLGSWSYAYDDAGRLTTQIDAKGQQTAFSYDRLGRVLSKVSGVGLPDAETVTNTYDEARPGYFNVGKLTTAANDNAIYTSDYDAGGRLGRDIRTVDGNAYIHGFAYDAGGRLTWKSYPSISIGPHAYNAAGQLTALAGTVTGTSYDAAGRVLTIAYANGVTTSYGYSATRGWLTSVSTVNGATTIQTATYSRDAMGRITGIDGNRAEDDWSYGYDALDRLLSATNTNSPALSQTFTYDLGGKLTSNSAVGSYTYPVQGSSAFQPHAVSTAGAWSFAYDLNGNQVARATAGITDRTIAYDNDNRPVSVTTGGATVTYLYGPDGERLKKLTGSGTTLYLGADSERDPAGGWTHYLTADAKSTGGVLNFLHRDHLQSIRRVTDQAGALTRASLYAPYGQQTETVLAPLSPAEPKGWIGERTDPETGLTYLHARHYDATLGRFLSPDWWDVSDPSVGTDRYGYSGGDPVNKADPNGHEWLWEEEDESWRWESHWLLRTFVPGQVAWDRAVTDAARGNLGGAALNSGLMIGEQVMTVVTAGASTVPGRIVAEEGAAASELATQAGILTNKASGDAVRDSIAARELTNLVEQTLTTVGGVRRIDIVVEGEIVIAIESKVGRTALEQRVRQEMARDWWLMRQGQVDKVIWEFTRSGVTGGIGPTKTLMEKLQKLGIEVRINR